MTDFERKLIAIAEDYVQTQMGLAPKAYLFWYGGLDAPTNRHMVYAAHQSDIDQAHTSWKTGAGTGDSFVLLVNERLGKVEGVAQGQ